MNITKLTNAQSFRGSVKMDKIAVAEQVGSINPHFKEQSDVFIKHINTLTEKLRNETPEDCNYLVDFKTSFESNGRGGDNHFYGVTVKELSTGEVYKEDSKFLIWDRPDERLGESPLDKCDKEKMQEKFENLTDRLLVAANPQIREERFMENASELQKRAFDKLI